MQGGGTNTSVAGEPGHTDRYREGRIRQSGAATQDHRPSRLHPGDPNLHRYDDYVELQMNAMMLMDGSNRVPGWAHRAPAFFPWHREMLRQFELDLQKIDPNVTPPYWDWTTYQSSDPVAGSPWTDDPHG